MSGFVVVSGLVSRYWRKEQPQRELRLALRLRGEELIETHDAEGLGIIAVRNRWEKSLHPGPMIAHEGLIAVVADASLYYVDELRARLGATALRPATSAAELILRAYLKYGARCAEFVEGDFAYAIVDGRSHALHLARDPFGSRGVWYGTAPDGWAAGSTPDAVRMIVGDQGIDRHELIRRLSFWTGRGASSVWRGVAELPAGHTVVLGDRGTPASRYWRPRTQSDVARLSLPEAAEALRGVLGQAVDERLAPGLTAVAMSGGRDSTAVVGSLASYRGPAVLAKRVHLISFAYPADDPGNEDEWVNAVAASYGMPVDWVPTESIPLIIDAPPDRLRRVDPEPHPYEGQNQALAAAAKAAGASVLLNGHGGDNIFAATPMWPADLLRQGRWVRFVRELRMRRQPLWRSSRDYYLRVAAPEAMLRVAERWRGKSLLDRPWILPRVPWLRLDDAAWQALEEENRLLYFEDPWAGWASTSRAQRRWALVFSSFARTNAALTAICWSQGVELRMPIFDRRVVDFAWSREAQDLCGVREHKLLLTQSMQGVLPDAVTAPRTRRTGTADGYSFRHFRRFLQQDASSSGALGEGLARHELLEPGALHATVAKVRDGGTEDALPLLVTIGADRWLTMP